MKKEDAIRQYNAAGEAVNKALDAIQAASAEDMPTAEKSFRDAQAEFKRCEANRAALEGVEATKRFAPVPTEDPNVLGMDAKEVRAYSMVRAINAMATGDWRGAELEREASDEIAKRTGKPARGIYIPADVQREKRAMGTGSAGAGGALVQTDLLEGSFIELLRNKMVVKQAGATVLSGLVGNIAIPRQTAGGTFYWVGSDGAPTGSQPSVDQVTMSPKVGGAYTDIGRSLLLQSSVDVESMVRNDLATVVALGIDLAALNGTGADNEPKGLAKITGVAPVHAGDGTNGAAASLQTIIDLETAVAAANADMGKLAYITNAKVRGKLKSTPKVSGYPSYIWETGTDAPLNGYNAFVSNQVPSNLTAGTAVADCSQIFYGNWSDLIVGQWGTLDLMVDPYTGSTSGTVRVVALQDVDIATRHAESFSVASDVVA